MHPHLFYFSIILLLLLLQIFMVFKWVMGFKKEVLSQAFMREVDLECFKNYLY